MFKKLICSLILVLIFCSTGWCGYLGIVNRARDTLAIPFVLLDDAGDPTSLVSGDSVYVQVVAPSGGVVYRDSMPYDDASIDFAAWEDFAGGQIYTYTEEVSVLDGASTEEGVYTVKIWAQDNTGVLITPTMHTFQMVNSTLESSLDSASFAALSYVQDTLQTAMLLTLEAYFGSCDGCYTILYPRDGSMNKDSAVTIDPSIETEDSLRGKVVWFHNNVPGVYDSSYFYFSFPW